MTNKTIYDENKAEMIGRIFTRSAPAEQVEILNILPLVLSAAVTDAINPCAFNVLILLLTLVLFKLGKDEMLKIGFAFIMAVFFMYFLLGIGSSLFFVILPQVDFIIVFISFLTGFIKILEFLQGSKYLPQIFMRRITISIESIIDIKTAFIVGMVTATLLLPCTSAPYFLILNLLSRTTTAIQGFILLFLYNLIIILPLFLINISFYQLTESNRIFIKEWILKKKDLLNLVTGIFLILLSSYFYIEMFTG